MAGLLRGTILKSLKSNYFWKTREIFLRKEKKAPCLQKKGEKVTILVLWRPFFPLQNQFISKFLQIGMYVPRWQMRTVLLFWPKFDGKSLKQCNYICNCQRT